MNRAKELKAISEWSRDIERDPFAFGASIDKNWAIKTLLEELTGAHQILRRVAGYIKNQDARSLEDMLPEIESLVRSNHANF
jgi:hypothetical protein